MRAQRGAVPPRAQEGLKPSWKTRGLFLPCVCVPTGDLVIVDADAVESHAGRIESVQSMAPGVLRVTIAVADGPSIRRGQFVSLVRPRDGLARPYSIADVRLGGRLELHVAVVRHGRMSQWLRDAAGETVHVRGPCGDCHYQADSLEQPLLLAGTGTGLAPLLGVVREALESRHRGPIHLYHGSAKSSGLYLREALRELSTRHPRVHIVGSVLEDDLGAGDVRVVALDAAIAADFPRLDGFRVYLCGAPAIVQRLKKHAFLAGASLNQIHNDPFITAPPPTR
jgi:NAD(P)H-flavin reductase